jgi:hypothetical protein
LNREQAYFSILDAIAKMQFNVALILEAKALEAEKAKNWLCNHLSSSSYDNHEIQLIEAIDIHQQMIDVIDGLTKMEAALGRKLKVILGHNESIEEGGFGGGNNIFGMGGQSK